MRTLKVLQIANEASVAATKTFPFTADSHKVRSVQAVWTAATASFTLTLQYSNDGVTWSNFTTGTAISDANGNVMWDVLDSKDALYWQVVATRSSGTLTTLKAYLAHVLR